MEPAKTPTRRRPTNSAGRMRQIGTAAAVVLSVTGLAAIATHGSQSGGPVPTVSCAPRMIVVDTSSGDRSPELSGFAEGLIDAAADTACR